MYTTVAGEQIPQGPDAFNPPAQFKTWADHAALWHNRIVVALDANRTALAAPELRDGLECYVTGTDVTWLYEGSSWRSLSNPFSQAAGKVAAAANTTGNTVVTFPAGRFSVAPVTQVTLTSVTPNTATICSAISSTQMTVQTFQITTGAAITAVSFDWSARQMTATTAAG